CGIRDRKLDPVAAVCDLTRLELDFALLGELAGVAQQIEQNLPQPHGIDRDRAQVLFFSASWPAVPTTSSIRGARSVTGVLSLVWRKHPFQLIYELTR